MLLVWACLTMVTAAAHRDVAVCVIGQPRSISLTARALNSNLLDHWDADAFVHAHRDDSWSGEPDKLRRLLGPRVVDLSLVAGVDPAVALAAASWAANWSVHGSPLAQYESRARCYEQVARHEERRGAAYAVYVRVRLDSLLLAPVPLAHLATLRRAAASAACTALVPEGEDYGGLQDRMLLGTRCAFAADSAILTTMAKLGGRHIANHWNPEVANAHNLDAALGAAVVVRVPLAACLLSIEGACRLGGELVLSERILGASLLSKRPHLCGDRLLAGGGGGSVAASHACDPLRPAIQDDAMRAVDPGFCALEQRCINVSSAPSPPVCLPDGSVVEAGELLAATAPCTWELPTVWWRAGAPPTSTSSCGASTLLARVRSGAVRKARDLELVVVRGARESVAWSAPYSAVRTLVGGSTIGREQGAYLKHLTEHYDHLPARLVFMHGREPSCGWGIDPQTGKSNGGHLLANTSVHSYLGGAPLAGEQTQAKRVFMPLSMRLTTDLTRLSMRNSFAYEVAVDAPPRLFPAGDEHWLPWQSLNETLWSFLERESIKAAESAGLPPRPPLSFREYFGLVFGRDAPEVVCFAQGAQFAATREALHLVPKHTYERLLALIEKERRVEVVYYLECTRARAHLESTQHRASMCPNDWPSSAHCTLAAIVAVTWPLLLGVYVDGDHGPCTGADGFATDTERDDPNIRRKLRRALSTAYYYGSRKAPPPAPPPSPPFPPSPPVPPLPPPTPPSPPLPPGFPPATPGWGFRTDGIRRLPGPVEGTLPGTSTSFGPPDCSNPGKTGCVTTPRVEMSRPRPPRGGWSVPDCSVAGAVGCVLNPVASPAAKGSVGTEQDNNVVFTQDASSLASFVRRQHVVANSLGLVQRQALGDVDGDGDLGTNRMGNRTAMRRGGACDASGCALSPQTSTSRAARSLVAKSHNAVYPAEWAPLATKMMATIAQMLSLTFSTATVATASSMR